MSDQLVTIATFDIPAKAHVARGTLEAAGIRAVVNNEEAVSALWLPTALGGVKVQVLEEDAERAVAVLEKELGPDESGPISEEQLAAEAEAAGKEEDAEPTEPDLQTAA